MTKPIRYRPLDISNQKLAEVTKYCPNSSLIKVKVFLLDIDENGILLKAEWLILALKCRFLRKESFENDMPVFAVQMTPNSPEYKVVIDSNQVLEFKSFIPLHAILRKPNLIHEFIWENSENGVSTTTN